MAKRVAILRVKKLKSLRSVLGSGRHTFREQPTTNAITEKLGENIILVGPSTAQGIVDAVSKRLEQVTEHQARAVPAIEYLITGSPGTAATQSRHYFDDALEWLRKKHGAENVISAVIHRDEKTPHLVAYVVPLVTTEGKTRKRSVNAGRNPDGSMIRKTIEVAAPGATRLSASHFLDGKQKLSDMQTDFAEAVGAKHGLVRGLKGSRAVHTTIKQFYGMLDTDVTEELGPQLAKFGRAMHLIARQKTIEADQAEQRAAEQTSRAEIAEAEADDARKQLMQWHQWIKQIIESMADALFTSPGALERASALLDAALRALGLAQSKQQSARFDVLVHKDQGARLQCFKADNAGEYLDTESEHQSIDAATQAGNTWLKRQRLQAPANQAGFDHPG